MDPNVVTEAWLRRKGNLKEGVGLGELRHLGLQRVDAAKLAGLDSLGELVPAVQVGGRVVGWLVE